MTICVSSRDEVAQEHDVAQQVGLAGGCADAVQVVHVLVRVRVRRDRPRRDVVKLRRQVHKALGMDVQRARLVGSQVAAVYTTPGLLFPTQVILGSCLFF